MPKHFVYKTTGTCSTEIHFDLDGERVKNIRFVKGCDGNLKAVSILAEGLTVDQIEEKCKDIKCEHRSTSCADQLAIAVRNAAAGLGQLL
ncbi:MAG: TIGR03905 family TSCPD domain-containing protein [Clostridiales bacterium]|nr:TIGR03905 family TSCPD domain-containing protein [Clostridiales bacterium]